MDVSEMLNSSDEDEPSAANVLQLLTLAWINERHCPELLKHESDLVDCMMDQIHQMEENLRSLNRDDFRLVPHQMEVDRIRYIISSYLRTRLEKIETFTEHLLKNDLKAEREDERIMSKGEYKFAESFMLNLKKHFYEEAIKYMPTLLRDTEGSNRLMEVKPNLNSTVFIRMVKTVPGVIICDQVVELAAGSRHLLPYKDVRHLVHNGSALLI